MWINLLEIPDIGKTFVCNRFTKELNEVLSDLIGSSDYTAEFTIRSTEQGSFELTGSIKTESSEECSRCAMDFQWPISESFKEMMLPELDQPRNATYAKANHFSEMKTEEFSVVEYKGHRFNMGEYLHEVVALALPFNPAPPVNAKEECMGCSKPVKEMILQYDEPLDAPINPFAALKGIKLN